MMRSVPIRRTMNKSRHDTKCNGYFMLSNNVYIISYIVHVAYTPSNYLLTYYVLFPLILS